jgi:hypothetical protein
MNSLSRLRPPAPVVASNVRTVSEHQPGLDILILGRWSHVPRERFVNAA